MLRQSIAEAEAALDSFEQDTANVERFLALAKKYTDFSELTTPMINEFIEKIIVHAPEKVDGDRTQQMDIYLKFIGRFDLPAPELTPEEEKRQASLHRHRVKSRERYQKIKAGEHAVGQPFKLICKCCGRTFYTQISTKKYCYYGLCGNRGYRTDLKDVRQLISMLQRCTNNLNQYAKRANETGSIYAADIEDL